MLGQPHSTNSTQLENLLETQITTNLRMSFTLLEPNHNISKQLMDSLDDIPAPEKPLLVTHNELEADASNFDIDGTICIADEDLAQGQGLDEQSISDLQEFESRLAWFDASDFMCAMHKIKGKKRDIGTTYKAQSSWEQACVEEEHIFGVGISNTGLFEFSLFSASLDGRPVNVNKPTVLSSGFIKMRCSGVNRGSRSCYPSISCKKVMAGTQSGCNNTSTEDFRMLWAYAKVFVVFVFGTYSTQDALAWATSYVCDIVGDGCKGKVSQFITYIMRRADTARAQIRNKVFA